jgi:hypothetical protein
VTLSRQFMSSQRLWHLTHTPDDQPESRSGAILKSVLRP